MSEPGRLGGTPQKPARFFVDGAEFAAWLEANHATAPDLWMELRKKHVAERGLVWEDAVVEALRFGWIDSKIERLHDDAIRKRWTPRRPRSKWSRVNVEIVQRLIAEGRMEPAGLAVFESRIDEPSGYSFEQPGDVALPDHYLAQMQESAAAMAFWAEAIPSYRKACAVWVTSAKQPATNDKRMRQLIEDHAHGRIIPSQRWGTEPKWVARAAVAAANVAE